ncbi:MAG: hypothetical protein K8R11_11945 [Methanococcoides sp.]|nr:hypothetical protein [Methanococcoides sp.]
MKKVCMFVVAMVCLFTCASAGAVPVTVYTDDVEASSGSSVEVPVYFTGASEIGSMDLVLKYDSDVLQAAGISGSDLGSNSFMESNVAIPGEVTVALADSSGITGDGAVIAVSFIVLGDIGTSSTVSVEEVVLHNVGLVEIVAETADGVVTVTDAGSESVGYGSMMLASVGILCICALFMRRRD